MAGKNVPTVIIRRGGDVVAAGHHGDLESLGVVVRGQHHGGDVSDGDPGHRVGDPLEDDQHVAGGAEEAPTDSAAAANQSCR